MTLPATYSFRQRSSLRCGATLSLSLIHIYRIVMWDKAAEFAEKYIRKGTKLYVEGKLRTRSWEDRNTIKHTVTEIYVENFDIVARNTNTDR